MCRWSRIVLIRRWLEPAANVKPTLPEAGPATKRVDDEMGSCSRRQGAVHGLIVRRQISAGKPNTRPT